MLEGARHRVRKSFDAFDANSSEGVTQECGVLRKALCDDLNENGCNPQWLYRGNGNSALRVYRYGGRLLRTTKAPSLWQSFLADLS